MLKSIKGGMSEMSGSAENCHVLMGQEFAKNDGLKYLLKEDGPVFVVLSSKKDDYIFTGTVLVHVDGESAASSKRSVKRYRYATTRIDNVGIETAGHADRDCEIKFTVNGAQWSIDVFKQELDKLIPFYKVLVEIEQLMDAQARAESNNNLAMANALSCMTRLRLDSSLEHPANPAFFTEMAKAQLQWITSSYESTHCKDYSHVFSKLHM